MIVDFVPSEWNTHTPADGSNIGGAQPTKYGVVSGIPGSGGSLVYIEGPAYADFEAYITRPVLPNTGSLELRFTLMPDTKSETVAQAIETDTILTIGGWTYNLSAQVNYEEGGMLQIADAAGKWVDTGLVVGEYQDGGFTGCSIQYTFDEATHTSSVVSFKNALNKFIIPENLQNIPAQQRGWADGAIFQVQLDLASKGGAFSVVVDDVKYRWQ